MVSLVVKVCFFISCCGVLLTTSVESSSNYDNGEEMYNPFGRNLKALKVDEVNKGWNTDDGIPMFNPPKRMLKMNDEIVSDWQHDDGKPMYIPSNTNLAPSNSILINKERPSGGEDMYIPVETPSTAEPVKPHALRNYRRSQISRWYPRGMKMNIPFNYYY